MKVLVADKLAEAGLERLRAAGIELVIDAGLKADALPEALATHDPDALVVRSTKVSAAAIAGGKRLKLVVRGGAGYDTIDCEAASNAGVPMIHSSPKRPTLPPTGSRSTPAKLPSALNAVSRVFATEFW